MLAFRSLDPFRALREPDRRRRDEERPFPLQTKNWQQNPKRPLDRKSPIQVACEHDFRGRGGGSSGVFRHNAKGRLVDIPAGNADRGHWGMNVGGIPFSGSPNGFWVIGGLIIAVFALVAIVLYRFSASRAAPARAMLGVSC